MADTVLEHTTDGLDGLRSNHWAMEADSNIIESKNHMQCAHVATVKLEWFSFYTYCA